MMKKVFILLACLGMFTASAAYAHGGGCRKANLPEQCCHMDNSTGVVHCH